MTLKQLLAKHGISHDPEFPYFAQDIDGETWKYSEVPKMGSRCWINRHKNTGKKVLPMRTELASDWRKIHCRIQLEFKPEGWLPSKWVDVLKSNIVLEPKVNFTKKEQALVDHFDRMVLESTPRGNATEFHHMWKESTPKVK